MSYFFGTTLSLSGRIECHLFWRSRTDRLSYLLWKNHFLITAKVLHSIRMCLTVQVVWQVKHCGCGSCFKMKEWVSLAWPIRNRDITNNLFSSWFSRCWSPLSKGGLNLEEFIVDFIAPLLLLFCVEEFINCWFQVSISDPRFIGCQI